MHVTLILYRQFLVDQTIVLYFLGSIKLDNCYILMIGAGVPPFCSSNSSKCSKCKMIEAMVPPTFGVNKAELDRNSLMIGYIVAIFHTHHTLYFMEYNACF